ncbi:glycosyl transferase family 2 [Candidatus Omnitrophus magneticus]|uniref:Glycosyl transferase family 2 n=1 Tax=Candidatus Omnitrophus magneticus TaxID=1609969 RepID=A0A0F0CVJ8_9BACT|nr:glycosyl transferase family 2 [Candidatus Omnitrophus magneticus]
MKSLFIICVFFILYTYLGYPLILSILSFFIRQDETPSKNNPNKYPLVSLIISAYNEETVIAEKIKNSLELNYPKDKLEIIVASESIDSTNEITQKYAKDGVKLYAFTTRIGKAGTLYRTIPLAKGSIIIFSDANGMYDKNAVKKIVEKFYDKKIGCVSGQLRYTNPGNTTIGESEGLYWQYEQIIKHCESKILSLLGVNGSIFAIRKELYSPITIDRGDDFELAVRVALNGHGVILEKEAISYEKASVKTKDEFKRKVRIISWCAKSAFILLQEAFHAKKWLIAFEIISHKILRWFIPFFLCGIFIASISCEGLIYSITILLQAAFYMAAFTGYILEKNNKPIPFFFNIPYYFCVVYLAALAGIYKLIFNKQKSAWEKVR